MYSIYNWNIVLHTVSECYKNVDLDRHINLFILQLNHYFFLFRLSSASECDRKLISKLRKKLPYQSSVHSEIEKQNYGSSSESLEPISKVRGSPSPAPFLEPPQRKVRILKPTEHTKFGDERIVMVTSKHIPFLVCSFIPYKKSR